jgi:hypothetical protein
METRTLLAAMGVGVITSGLVVAVLLPSTPPSWHSPPLVWLSTLVIIALCVGAAARVSRLKRD